MRALRVEGDIRATSIRRRSATPDVERMFARGGSAERSRSYQWVASSAFGNCPPCFGAADRPKGGEFHNDDFRVVRLPAPELAEGGRADDGGVRHRPRR